MSMWAALISLRISLWANTPIRPCLSSEGCPSSIKQELIGMRRLLALIDATASCQTGGDALERLDQVALAVQRLCQADGVLAHRRRRFRQTPIGIRPTPDQHDPMLHDHGNHLGIQLAQDRPGFGAAPLIDLALALPQLEQ